MIAGYDGRGDWAFTCPAPVCACGSYYSYRDLITQTRRCKRCHRHLITFEEEENR